MRFREVLLRRQMPHHPSPRTPHNAISTATVVLMSIVVPAVPGIIGALAAAPARVRVVYGAIGTVIQKARGLVIVGRADHSGKINKSPAPTGQTCSGGQCS